MRGVLATGALLTFLRGGPGAEKVGEALSQGAVIHTVNWAEVLTQLAGQGIPAAQASQRLAERGVLGQLLKVDAGLPEDAQVVADLSTAVRTASLSLGDRYCLALGRRLNVPVFTTDLTWIALELNMQFELIDGSNGSEVENISHS